MRYGLDLNISNSVKFFPRSLKGAARRELRDVETLVLAGQRFDCRWIKWHRNLSLAQFVVIECTVTGLFV